MLKVWKICTYRVLLHVTKLKIKYDEDILTFYKLNCIVIDRIKCKKINNV